MAETLKSRFATASAASYFKEKYLTAPGTHCDVATYRVKKSRMLDHQNATDLSAPAIRKGFRNSLTIIANMKAYLGNFGIRLGVVLIPSRELVNEEWAVANKVPLPDGFDASRS